jgi:hypothetical protein
MTKDLTEYRQPTRVSFNSGWSVRPKIGFFSELRPGQARRQLSHESDGRFNEGHRDVGPGHQQH